VGGENLVVVVRGQITGIAVEGERLLAAHQKRVRESAQEHDQGEDDVHDTDLLVIDTGDPFAPEVAPQTEIRQQTEHDEAADGDAEECHDQDWFVIRDSIEGQSTEDKLLEIRVGKHVFCLFVTVIPTLGSVTVTGLGRLAA
jgi:hypothetical protein